MWTLCELSQQRTEKEAGLQSFAENHQEQTRPLCRWTGAFTVLGFDLWELMSCRKVFWWKAFFCVCDSQERLAISKKPEEMEDVVPEGEVILTINVYYPATFERVSRTLLSRRASRPFVNVTVLIPCSSPTSDPTPPCWWRAPTAWSNSGTPFAVSAICKCVENSATCPTWLQTSSAKWVHNMDVCEGWRS